MKYKEMKKILNELNKNWKFDFVSATSGQCCRSCSIYSSERITEKARNAKTHFIIQWFYKGMNYHKKFEDTNMLYIGYSHKLPEGLTMEKIIADLKIKLDGKYDIIPPKNTMDCLQIWKID